MKECKSGEGILFCFSVIIIVSLLIIIANVLQSNREMGVVMNGRFLSKIRNIERTGRGDWNCIRVGGGHVCNINITTQQWDSSYSSSEDRMGNKIQALHEDDNNEVHSYTSTLSHCLLCPLIITPTLPVTPSKHAIENVATILLFFIRRVCTCPLFRIDCQFRNNNETQLEQFRM